MKPAPFDYVRPESLDDALAALAEGGGDDAKVLAGGQSLVPALNMRLLRPTLLVDVNRVAGLDGVTDDGGALRVGAVVRQADSRLRAHPALAAVLPHVGHTVTRNRGTVGGSIAHADAAAELPLALVATGGSVIAASIRGRREIRCGRAVPRPIHDRARAGRARRGDRVAGSGREATGSPSLSSHSVAATSRSAWPPLTSERDAMRVVVGSVTPTPTVLEVDPEHPGESAAGQVEPWGSIHASPDYLRHLVRVLVDHVVARARTDAT